jgi:hypothetical protein
MEATQTSYIDANNVDLVLDTMSGSYTIEEFTIANDGNTTYRPISGTIYDLDDSEFTADADELLAQLN